MSHKKSNLAEYGFVSEPATSGSVQIETTSPGRLPAALMHPSVQRTCDQKAAVFAWVRELKFNFKANDKKMKLAVLNFAAKHARPLRTRAVSKAPGLPTKYRVNDSADKLKVLDFIYGAYTPDKRGFFKYMSFFDSVGNFRFETEKVAKQLKIPLRTLQRIMAKLTALRLIDRQQKATQNQAGEYRGSTMWVTARADIFLNYVNQENIRKTYERGGRILPETPTEMLLGVPGVEATESPKVQPEKPVDSEANGNDNIVISLSVIMEPPPSYARST
jgi:hypothetical protein